MEKAQDVNSNEVICNQRDGAACNEEKIGAVIVECECNIKSDDTYKVRTREDDTEEQSKLPLHHRLQATQVLIFENVLWRCVGYIPSRAGCFGQGCIKYSFSN